jgi:cell wall-associated NlpC family hydrolase
MKYAACKLPAAVVRKKACHQSEMTNQLLFGETVEVLKKKKKWAKVKGSFDGYTGWTLISQLEEVSEEMAITNHEYVAADLINRIETNKHIMHIPVGSSLPFFGNSSGEIRHLYSGAVIKRNDTYPDIDLLKRLTFRWLNAPYQWGGRTILGVDCSGFVQVNYKMMGIDLKRDAWQQAKQGGEVASLEKAKAGDLAFFNDKEEIVHVGILLSQQEIIHASGCVRIDRIDEKGITNADTGKRTHKLKLIRRFW